MGQLLTFLPPRRKTAPVKPEAVADLMLALEASPLAPMRGAVQRQLGGCYTVLAVVSDQVFSLSADDARLASHALFAEQGHVGATEASFQLMDLAEQADRLSRQGVA